MVFKGEVLCSLLEVKVILDLSSSALCGITAIHLLPERESILSAYAQRGSTDLNVRCLIFGVSNWQWFTQQKQGTKLRIVIRKTD